MSTKNNVLTVLAEIFSSKVDVETDDSQQIVMIHPALIKAWENIEKGKLKKEAEESVNANGSNGGNSFKKEYEAPEAIAIDEELKENLEKMSKILKGEKPDNENERND